MAALKTKLSTYPLVLPFQGLQLFWFKNFRDICFILFIAHARNASHRLRRMKRKAVSTCDVYDRDGPRICSTADHAYLESDGLNNTSISGLTPQRAQGLDDVVLYSDSFFVPDVTKSGAEDSTELLLILRAPSALRRPLKCKDTKAKRERS